MPGEGSCMSPVSPPQGHLGHRPPLPGAHRDMGCCWGPRGGSRPRRRRHQVGGRLQGAGGRLELYGEPIDPVEQGAGVL